LAGKDYFTLPEMMSIINDALKHHNIFWGHLDKQWDFTHVRGEMGIEFHRLRNAHSLCFTRTPRGITVRWRQWVADTLWSRPLLLVPAEKMKDVCRRLRPPEVPLAFSEEISRGLVTFLDKLDILLQASDSLGSSVHGQKGSDSVGSTVQGKQARGPQGITARGKPSFCRNEDRQLDMAWLRRVARGQELSLMSSRTIDDIIQDLVRIGRGRGPPAQGSIAPSYSGLEDTVVQLFPGSDVPGP